MLNIDVSKEKEATVIKVSGTLDGQSYQDLIATARDVHNNGSKNLVVDLSELNYISSAGLVALHCMALLSKGEKLPDTKLGWSALKAVDRARESGAQKNVKLLNPRPEVLNVLEMVGFSTFFEIFTDKQKAVDSF